MAIQQTRRALAPTDEQPSSVEPAARERARRDAYDRWEGRSKNGREDRFAKALGWFSIGLGLTEVLAPKGLAKLIGIREGHTALFRMLGLREIASGVGILTGARPAGWVWSRVAGDALDISLLSAALKSDESDRARLIGAAAAVIGITALDILNARQTSASAGIPRVKSITINRSPEEVYRFWRKLENLPQFMNHLDSVREIDGLRSHWVAKAPAGMKVEWDAEIVEDRPNELIAWRSLEGADIENSGSVRFQSAPGGRGTEVKVSILYNPPGGRVGAAIASIFGEEPDEQIKGDLRRFKQVIETGEVVRSDASIHAGMHAARPE